MGAIHSHTGASVNEPVHFVTFDFADFTSANVTEWRIYAYNTATSTGAVRFDDITLNGSTASIPEPSVGVLAALAGLALIRRQRR